MEKKDWYKDWFNTPFYHILYKDRNHKEAEIFIKNITDFLKLPKSSHILDLPCGKGRHSIYLNSLGYTVTGADLSEKSIAFAQQFQNDTLRFKVHDMRNPFEHKYNVIANLFTSFGYFNESQNKTVLQNIKMALQPNGYFIFDFLNASRVRKNLISKEIKVVDSIPFYIQREIKNDTIVKNISFSINNDSYAYAEVVKYLDFRTLESMFEEVGFSISAVFGDYDLNPFDEEVSERLIMVAQ